MEILAILFLMICAGVGVRIFAGSMDGSRIDDHIRERGGRLIDKQWTPFGPGWFGSQHERLYEVRYEDADGNLHDATCKTSVFAGVYFTEDRIVEAGRRTGAPGRSREVAGPVERPYDVGSSARSREVLAAENRRLREEIERLRRGGRQ